MGKKKTNLFGYVYLLGAVLVIIGFCCPMFKTLFGQKNGFEFIDFENFSFVTVGALLIFIGAVLSALSVFIPQFKKFKFLFLLISIAGGIVLFIGFTTNGKVSKWFGKNLLKNAIYGFYIILLGWITSIAGLFLK